MTLFQFVLCLKIVGSYSQITPFNVLEGPVKCSLHNSMDTTKTCEVLS
jgi:hypothetical protein